MSDSMQGLKRSHRCTEVNEGMLGQTVTVMGWVNKRRDLGKLIFIALRDRSGLLQIYVDGNDCDEVLFSKAETLRSEYVIAVRGKVCARAEGNRNDNMETGSIEIAAEEIRVLSEALTPPFSIDAADVKDDIRLKYRYIDLRRPELQRIMKLRHDTAQTVRSFLSNEGFLEIETPMLTKSAPEGARDYLVPSRVHNGSFYALPQSPQLFKQLLMVSGMDRYFQIARCFRDEDLRADRQPEFTQIDMELSFVDTADIMDINERLIQDVFQKVMNLDVQIPFERMPYSEAMERFGSDKPDIRFGMELKDITALVRDCTFGVFQSAIEAGGSVRLINGKTCGSLPRKQIDALVEFAKTHGAKGLAWIALNENGDMKSSFAKFMTEEQLQAILKAAEAENGDLILICADKNTVVYNVLGALRCHLAKRLELYSQDEFRFLWVTDFPLLEWDEEENRFVAVHHPFTSPADEDIALLDTNPAAVRAKAYDMVLNGVELGGGSIRIFQPELQEKMFQLLGFTPEQAQENFGHLINAFKYGVPPHGGLAFGLDRIIMLMANAQSLRDVIAFPKVKDASCPLTAAPGEVSGQQLEELGIAVVTKED